MLKEVKALLKVNEELEAHWKKEDALYGKQGKLEASISKQMKKLYPDVYKKARTFARHTIGKYKVAVALSYWKVPTVNIKKK